MKRFATLGLAVMFMLGAGAAAQAELMGELGILDVSGNNPATEEPWQAGDPYRLFFLTSANTTAESSDIATYDAFVQGLANASTAYNMSPATWRVFGTTPDVDVADHNQIHFTESSPGDPVYQLDGATLVAKDFETLIYTLPNVQPLLTDAGDSVGGTTPWTGSTRTEYPDVQTYKYDQPGKALGDAEGITTWGNQGFTYSARGWYAYWRADQTNEKPLYAMSEELNIVPEPATLALLGLGGLATLIRRRRR